MISTQHLFPHFPDTSKIWIYTSNKPLQEAETAAILDELKKFVAQWKSHNNRVVADADVVFQYFLLLTADESREPVSGCAIDRSIVFIQQLAQRHHLNLFDRFYTIFVKDNQLWGADRNTFQQYILNEIVNEQTLVFNNAITHLHQLRNEWLVPLKTSWHSKVFQFPNSIVIS